MRRSTKRYQYNSGEIVWTMDGGENWFKSNYDGDTEPTKLDLSKVAIDLDELKE